MYVGGNKLKHLVGKTEIAQLLKPFSTLISRVSSLTSLIQ